MNGRLLSRNLRNRPWRKRVENYALVSAMFGGCITHRRTVANWRYWMTAGGQDHYRDFAQL